MTVRLLANVATSPTPGEGRARPVLAARAGVWAVRVLRYWKGVTVGMLQTVLPKALLPTPKLTTKGLDRPWVGEAPPARMCGLWFSPG